MIDQIANGQSTASSDRSIIEKEPVVQIARFEIDEADDDADGERARTKSTREDSEDMRRMGKNQQLVRRFRLLSVASFVALATAAWEIGLFLITPGLVDGGRPALVYNMVWSFVGFAPIYLSMAEMSSMAPIAGAQYHWVSEFAPESMQRILSYITGWTSTLAWQAGNAIGVFLVGTLIQSIIQVNNPDYAFPAWHATLLVAGSTAIAFAGNTYGSRILPHWQNAVFAIHVMGYFGLIIPVWVNAPKVTHREVWVEFENNGGWSNMALTILVGQVAGIYQQIGIDTAAHMAEEVKDAARSVPRAMITVFIVNFVLIFPAIITICYHMPVVADALEDPTLYPVIYVLRLAMSPGWLTVMLVVIVLILTASNISYLAAVTRDLFAFARDHGLPFSDWISRVEPKRKIPQNATILTSFISIALALIYLGSPTAFYAITSLSAVSLLQCYCVSIGCVLWRRIYHPETLPPASFSLGKWGVPINAAAVLYAFWSFFWSFWPQATPITASGFNWSSVLFMATIMGAMVDFTFRARHKYRGPVLQVMGRFSNPAPASVSNRI